MTEFRNRGSSGSLRRRRSQPEPLSPGARDREQYRLDLDRKDKRADEYEERLKRFYEEHGKPRWRVYTRRGFDPRGRLPRPEHPQKPLDPYPFGGRVKPLGQLPIDPRLKVPPEPLGPTPIVPQIQELMNRDKLGRTDT